MPTVVPCPSCATKLRAPDHLAGRQTKCPKCGAAISIPTATAEAVAPTRKAPTPRQVRTVAPPVAAPDDDDRDDAADRRPAPRRSTVLAVFVFLFGGLTLACFGLAAVATFLVMRGPIVTQNETVHNPRPGVIVEHKSSSVSFNPAAAAVPAAGGVLFGGLFVWALRKWRA